MTDIDRRKLLRGTAAAAGGALLGGPFLGFVARDAAGAAGPTAPDVELVDNIADLRDGVVRLHVPEGFRYRSFHDTETPVTLDDGTLLPGRHDGMGAFKGRDGDVVLIRNHEVNGPVAAFGPADAPRYDTMTGGGTTTVVTSRRGEVKQSHTSISGTQMNCSGGRMPWGSWVTCEETVNGPDVGPDFTNAPNTALTKPHGFVFEVPVRGEATAEPITAAGRFTHEAVAFDPHSGYLYLTEDSFEFPSGFYRYKPRRNPMHTGSLDNRGRLQMLAVRKRPNLHLEANQERGATYDVKWVDIDDPAPSFPYTPGQVAPTTNDDATVVRAQAGVGAGRRVLLPARGRRLRRRGHLLQLDPGRRRRGDRARAARGRRLRQRVRPDLGVLPEVERAARGLPVAGAGHAGLPGQRHHQPARHPGRLRGPQQRQLPAGVDPQGRALPDRAQPAWSARPARRGSTTSSPGRRSAPTGTRCSSTSRPAGA